jgi:oxalate decarboxylase
MGDGSCRNSSTQRSRLHPNADEWQYWISGQARMTVFSAGARARTFDFHAGDVGYVPRAMGHYVENTGNESVRYLELFRSAHYEDVPVMEWMANTPHDLVAQHLNIDPAELDRPPTNKLAIVPA